MSRKRKMIDSLGISDLLNKHPDWTIVKREKTYHIRVGSFTRSVEVGIIELLCILAHYINDQNRTAHYEHKRTIPRK